MLRWFINKFLVNINRSLEISLKTIKINTSKIQSDIIK